MPSVVHAWSVLCEKVLTDNQTNNISLDVVEQISISGLPALPTGAKGFVIPMRLQLASMWYRDNFEVADKCDARLVILSPEGETLSKLDIVADLTSAPRARTICGLEAFPVSRQGIYKFVVSQKTTKDEWKEVARLPLEIVISQGPPPMGIRPAQSVTRT